MTSSALVSVVICSYNDRRHLRDCLNALLACTYSRFEIVFVDDGSTDGTVDEVSRMLNASNVRSIVVRNERNVGLARARNIGATASHGELIAFLDSDTIVDPRWLDEAANMMQSDASVGAMQSKLLLVNSNRFDYAGNYLSQFGLLVQRVREGEEDSGQLNFVSEIFAAKGAAMFIRRDVLDRIGMFDEDYSIYMEETDVCWRVWLAGYKVVFVPASVVYHDFNRATQRVSRPAYAPKYQGAKNTIMTLVKNLEGKNLVRMVALNLCMWVGLSLIFVRKKRYRDAKWIVTGLGYNLVNLKQIWKKRLYVQHNVRKVEDAQLFPSIVRKTPFRYFADRMNSMLSSGY